MPAESISPTFKVVLQAAVKVDNVGLRLQYRF
jgi:hypothetical protein